MGDFLQNVIDTVGLPIRSLLVRERSTWLFTSLRDERMSKVRQFCLGRVLDLGCGPGNLFAGQWTGGQAVGADVFPYQGIDVLVVSTALPFPDSSFDTVTLIAVGGHIPKSIRHRTFEEIYRVLRPRGRIVMTEGEIITQTIHHKVQFFLDHFRAEKNMDTVRGMEEDEEFAMPHSEIQDYLVRLFGNFRRMRFQLGLNNIYVAVKNTSGHA